MLRRRIFQFNRSGWKSVMTGGEVGGMNMPDEYANKVKLNVRQEKIGLFPATFLHVFFPLAWCCFIANLTLPDL